MPARFYRTRGRCRPRRPRQLRPKHDRTRLLLFLARWLTPEQWRRARDFADLDALRFIADGFAVRA